MIDIHSHLIHGVDDGPSRIEESVRMVEEAERLGIQLIIATPHYQENIYNMEMVEENYQELLCRTKNYDVVIKIGYEVFVDPYNMPMSLTTTKGKKSLSLNRTEHVLFEFPFNAKPNYCLDAIRNLQLENIVPVIAHPERNRNFLNNISDLILFIKSGCLIQLDTASIAGLYGIRVKEFAKRLVKMNLADIIASNAHDASDYSRWYFEAYKNVIKWSGQENAYKLFCQNAKNMTDDAEESIFKVIG